MHDAPAIKMREDARLATRVCARIDDYPRKESAVQEQNSNEPEEQCLVWGHKASHDRELASPSLARTVQTDL